MLGSGNERSLLDPVEEAPMTPETLTLYIAIIVTLILIIMVARRIP